METQQLIPARHEAYERIKRQREREYQLSIEQPEERMLTPKEIEIKRLAKIIDEQLHFIHWIRWK